MRRIDRERSAEFAWAVADTAEYCVVSTVGRDGLPYAVPMNAVRKGESFYLHSAGEGRKNDAFRSCGEVVLVFVRDAVVDPAGLTTRYASAIAEGKICEVREPDEKSEALCLLCRRFAPGPEALAVARRAAQRTTVWRVDVRSITGKENRA